MAKIYKDTRVDLRPYSPSAAVSIPIPTQASSQSRARFSISSLTDQDGPIAKDEDEFSRRYLATQGSIYFRKRNVFPRAFLWRVVNDNRVLEIRCADLVKGGIEHHEYTVTLRLDFQEEILPSGVDFADVEDHEVMNVFVITASKQLHTLSLRPEFFRRIGSIDENISDWCKSFVPAPLSFSHPHRLHASSPLELFISLDNGALLRLTRRSGDDGAHWTPITFDERTWGASIRGLVRWNAQSSLKYQGRSLDVSSANAIATTSDQTYVFVVCLNHTLKVWNLATNKIAATKDLLDREIQHDTAPYTLNPADSSFIRVFNAERALDGTHRYYVVTFSPFEDGQFKFWAVRGGLTSPLEIEGLYPGSTLRPLDPDPTGNVFWSISDFQLKPAEEGKKMELWVLWRNGGLYQLYSLHFNFETLVTDWTTNWVSTVMDSRDEEPPPVDAVSDDVDPTEQWMKFILQPNKYLPEVLDTALSIYQEAMKPVSPPSPQKKGIPLPERLCSIVTASVSLRKYADEEMDFDRFRTDTDAKWRQFWQIADDLNKRRLEPVSFAYDLYYDTPWMLLTDSCAVIRECSSTELLLHNSPSELRSEGPNIVDRWRHRNLGSEVGDMVEQASHLMQVASHFRKKFPPELEVACQLALRAELFSEPSFSVQDRIDAFRDQCDFGLVSNKTYDDLVDEMGQYLDIALLPSEVFYTIVESVPLGFPGKDSDLLTTYFGVKVTVSGAQETISFTRKLLTDLLLLVVFVDGEVGQEEGSSFDPVNLFEQLVMLLKEYEMMYWLSTNTRLSPDKSASATENLSPQTFSLNDSPSKTKRLRMATILEDLFAPDIKPRQSVGFSQSYTLTLGIRDLISWVTRPGEVTYPNALAYIECDLIAKGNIDLAWDFLRFQATTSWATYVKGRLYVAMSEFDTAALYFRKAAYLLSCGKPLGNLHEMSSTLLDIMSVDCFHNGLPKYFQHILSVFEQVRSFSHVAEFASLALQALAFEPRVEHDPELATLRTDLLARLFYASLQTRQFDQAYSALSRYQDLALQKSALTSLIKGVLNASGPGTAGLEQILHFPTALVPNIASYVDETLVSLARKQTSQSSFLDVENKSTDGTPDYQRVLQAYRIARNDYRGAAEIAYKNVQRLRQARENSATHLIHPKGKETEVQPVEESDPESKAIRHELLSLINLLACVDKTESYILVDKEDNAPPTSHRRSFQFDDDNNVFMEDAAGSPTPHERPASRRLSSSSKRRDSATSPAGSGPKAATTRRRVIITLDHLRREYQSELDRVSRIERGDWEFGVFGPEPDQADNDDTMLL